MKPSEREGLIDWAAMEAVAASLGQEVLRKLVSAYVRGLSVHAVRIEQALAEDDLTGLRHEVHDLTSESGSLAVRGLSGLAMAAETAILDGNQELAYEKARSILEALPVVEKELADRFLLAGNE